MNTSEGFKVGWASADITPDKPVRLWGQFYCRVSESVRDPLTVTALALSSTRGDTTTGVVMVSCDVVAIPDSLLKAVRAKISRTTPDLDPLCVYLNATHTHTGPDLLLDSDWTLTGGGISSRGMTLELPEAMPVADVSEFAASRIATAVEAAWKNRQAGSIGYGVGQAVIGRNRRASYLDGSTHMYGATNSAAFSHFEGYEDHTVNLMATWDVNNKLTGLIVNVACPSQVSESDYLISADYWHDTRLELRRQLGKGLFVLPQCSTAGDLSPHVLLNDTAERRMERLAGLLPLSMEEITSGAPPATREEQQESERRGRMKEASRRKAIALRLAQAVNTALPLMARERAENPVLAHRVETVHLLRRRLSEADVQEALDAAAPSRASYETLLEELKAHPERRNEPRWYAAVTRAYCHVQWCEGVAKRFEIEKTQPRYPAELHVLRVGDVVFASNPFELYLDFGIRIKARSPAIQTFLTQLTGSGTYLPTARAIAGKSYGASPASTPVGPEGGQELVEWTLKTIQEMWN